MERGIAPQVFFNRGARDPSSQVGFLEYMFRVEVVCTDGTSVSHPGVRIEVVRAGVPAGVPLVDDRFVRVIFPTKPPPVRKMVEISGGVRDEFGAVGLLFEVWRSTATNVGSE